MVTSFRSISAIVGAELHLIQSTRLVTSYKQPTNFIAAKKIADNNYA